MSIDDKSIELACQILGLPHSLADDYSRNNVSTLYDWQWQCLFNGNNVKENLVYCAPTGGGKTLVAELLILHSVLAHHKQSIFVLPFVSLVLEKEKQFKRLLASTNKLQSKSKRVCISAVYGEHCGIEAIKSNIIICTIEKANSLINQIVFGNRVANLGCVAVDEVHVIGESFNGYLLEILISKIKLINQKSMRQQLCSELLSSSSKNSSLTPQFPRIQTVALSATMANVQTIADWMEARLFTTDYRPIPLAELVKAGNCVFDKLGRQVNQLPPAAAEDPDNLVPLTCRAISQGQQVLIFCSSKILCAQTCKLLMKSTSFTELATGHKHHVESTRARTAAVAQLTLSVCRDDGLIACVGMGVAFHHAGLCAEDRSIVESHFRNGSLLVLAATTTLAAGVNLPAGFVIIRNMTVGRDSLSVIQYKQMCGRAGRAGQSTAGVSVLMVKASEKDRALDLVNQQYPNIISRLNPKLDGGNGWLKALIELIGLGLCSSLSELLWFARQSLMYKQQVLGEGPNSSSFVKENIEAESNLGGMEPIICVVISLMEFLVGCHCVEIDNCARHDALGEYDHILELSEEVPVQLTILDTPYFMSSPIALSRFGRAIMRCNLCPDEAIAMYDSLLRAQEGLNLESNLHVLYLVCPLEHSIIPNFRRLFDAYEQSLKSASKTFANIVDLIGADRSLLVKWSFQPPARPAVDGCFSRLRMHYLTAGAHVTDKVGLSENEWRVLSCCKRLWGAMALQAYLECNSNAAQVEKLCQTYDCTAVELSELQFGAKMMGSRVQRFCAEIGWQPLEKLIKSFKDSISSTINDEVKVLLEEVPMLSSKVAQILVENNVKSIKALANCNCSVVTQWLQLSTGFEWQEVEQLENRVELAASEDHISRMSCQRAEDLAASSALFRPAALKQSKIDDNLRAAVSVRERLMAWVSGLIRFAKSQLQEQELGTDIQASEMLAVLSDPQIDGSSESVMEVMSDNDNEDEEREEDNIDSDELIKSRDLSGNSDSLSQDIFAEPSSQDDDEQSPLKDELVRNYNRNKENNSSKSFSVQLMSKSVMIPQQLYSEYMENETLTSPSEGSRKHHAQFTYNDYDNNNNRVKSAVTDASGEQSPPRKTCRQSMNSSAVAVLTSSATSSSSLLLSSSSSSSSSMISCESSLSRAEVRQALNSPMRCLQDITHVVSPKLNGTNALNTCSPSSSRMLDVVSDEDLLLMMEEYEGACADENQESQSSGSNCPSTVCGEVAPVSVQTESVSTNAGVASSSIRNCDGKDSNERSNNIVNNSKRFAPEDADVMQALRSPYLTPYTASKVRTPGKYLYIPSNYHADDSDEDDNNGNGNGSCDPAAVRMKISASQLRTPLFARDVIPMKSDKALGFCWRSMLDPNNCISFLTSLSTCRVISFELLHRRVPIVNPKQRKAVVVQQWSELISWSCPQQASSSFGGVESSTKIAGDYSGKRTMFVDPHVLIGIAFNFGDEFGYYLPLPCPLPLLTVTVAVEAGTSADKLSCIGERCQDLVCQFVGLPVHKCSHLFPIMANFKTTIATKVGTFKLSPSTQLSQCSLQFVSKLWMNSYRRAVLVEWRKGSSAEWRLVNHIMCEDRITKVGLNMKTKMVCLRERDVILRGPLEDPVIALEMLETMVVSGCGTHSSNIAPKNNELAKLMVELHELKLPSANATYCHSHDFDVYKSSNVAAAPPGSSSGSTQSLLQLHQEAVVRASNQKNACYRAVAAMRSMAFITSFMTQHCGPRVMEVFRNIEMPLLLSVCDAEYNGVGLDTQFISQLRQDLEDRLQVIRFYFNELQGPKFNLDSHNDTAALKKLVLDNLTRQISSMLQSSSQASTSHGHAVKLKFVDILPVQLSDALSPDQCKDGTLCVQSLADILLAQHPLVQLISEHRSHTRTLPLCKTILFCKRYDRARGIFHTLGTDTGRLVVCHPPLQQIPHECRLTTSQRVNLMQELQQLQDRQNSINTLNVTVLLHCKDEVQWVRVVCLSGHANTSYPAEAVGRQPGPDSPGPGRECHLMTGRLVYVSSVSIARATKHAWLEYCTFAASQGVSINDISNDFVSTADCVMQQWNCEMPGQYASDMCGDHHHVIPIVFVMFGQGVGLCAVPADQVTRLSAPLNPNPTELQEINLALSLGENWLPSSASTSKTNNQSVASSRKVMIPVRNGFRASKGYVLLAADYSQVELRLLAHLSNDKNLRQAFLSGEDVFKNIAADWRKKSLEQVTKEERNCIKQMCYAVIYGAGPKLVSEQAGIALSEATRMFSEFLHKYPGITTFVKTVKAQCRARGYVETLLGRRRCIAGITSSDTKQRSRAERQAVNSLCQGSAADLIKLAMINIHSSLCNHSVDTLNTAAAAAAACDRGEASSNKRSDIDDVDTEEVTFNCRRRLTSPGAALYRRYDDVRLVLQVHDELVYEVKHEHVSLVAGIVKECMENALELQVPLVVQLSVGQQWGTMEPLYDHGSMRMSKLVHVTTDCSAAEGVGSPHSQFRQQQHATGGGVSGGVEPVARAIFSNFAD